VVSACPAALLIDIQLIAMVNTLRGSSRTTRLRFLPLAVVLAVALLAAPLSGVRGAESPTAQLAELQGLLLAYADKYMAGMAQALNEISRRHPDDKLIRASTHAIKLDLATGVQRIAVGRNPEVSLLDMMVFASLQRLVYESPDAKKLLHKDRDDVIEAARFLEKEIWDIGALYLDADQLDEIRNLIKRWRAKHPRLLYVSYIRFGDFAADRAQSTLIDKSRGRGFLVDLSGTEQAVDEIRLLAERALHMSERMPLFIEWQIEQTFYKLALEPEVQQTLKQSVEFTITMNRFADAMDKLPKQVATERKATIRQLSGEIAKERSEAIRELGVALAAERHASVSEVREALATERVALFTELDTRQAMLAGAVSELRAGIVDADKLAVDVGNTSVNINQALESADKLMARFEKPDTGEPSEPFDINSYNETIRNLTIAIQELNTLALSAERLTGGESAFDSLFDRILWTGTLLIVILMVAVFFTMLTYRAVARRIIPQSSFEPVSTPPKD
jgi:hypothetical protein